jgi:hypothetical protein
MLVSPRSIPNPALDFNVQLREECQIAAVARVQEQM